MAVVHVLYYYNLKLAPICHTFRVGKEGRVQENKQPANERAFPWTELIIGDKSVNNNYTYC